MLIYDERASGDMGWRFVNAGESYRRLINVSEKDQLMMIGLFKQATMGDCEVGEAKKNKFGTIENKYRNEWLKHKGMDFVEAMEKYIEKLEEFTKIYMTKSTDQPNNVTNKNDQSKTLACE